MPTVTDVYNFVLNTVGSSAFGQTMGKAQDAINKVTLATNRASQAAKTGRVNADLQRTAQEKANASYNLAGIRLDLFRDKMARNTVTLAQSQAAQVSLAASIAKTTANLAFQEARLTKLQTAGKKNNGQIAQFTAAVEASKQSIKDETASLDRANKKVDEATAKEKLYQGQLRSREARLDAQKAKMEQVTKPLSRFESFLATMLQIYNAVNKASTAYEKFSKNIERTLRIIDKVKAFFGGGGATAGAGGGLSSMTGLKLPSITGAITSMTSGLSFLGATAAHVLGDIIVGGLRTVAQGFVDLARSAVDSVASFERLYLSFKALLAVQATNTDETLSLDDALSQSGTQASKLIKWLEKLAIISPFSAEDVKSAFQNAFAMGFNTEQAARLTRATLDWAAATGKSGAQAEHAVFVLGQMRSAGKLLYQDLYQLAQLGIGMDQINRALAKSLGKTTDEIKRMREEGSITAAQGITAIVQFMEKFQGAAAAQAHTLSGLMASLSDIGPIFLRSFFGPMDEASGRIDGLLGVIRKRLDTFVTFLQSEWLIKNVAVLGRGFGDIAERAFAWGENIVFQLAHGMVAATFTIMDALANIGKIIGFWLSPGSPPKLLPDIDKWGQAAMQEFLNGFALADMEVFKTIGSTLEQVIRSTITTGEGDKVGILERIFGTRATIGQLVDMLRTAGNVTEAMFQRVFNAIGGPSKAVQDYLRTYVALQQQNKKVTAAQDELNRVTKYYADLLKPVNAELSQVSNAQQDLLDEQQKRMLQMVLDDPNALASEKDMARLEIEKINASKRQRLLQTEADTAIQAAQDKVDAETVRQQQLADQLALQQELIDAQTQQNALVQEYLDLLKSLAERDKAAAGGGGGAPTAPTGEFSFGAGGGDPFKLPDISGAFDKEMEKLRAKFEQKLAVLRSIWRALWYNHILPLFEPFKEAWGRVQTAWDKFVKALEEKGPKLQEVIGKVVAQIIKFAAEEGPKFLDKITSIITTLTEIWDKHGDTILEIIGFLVLGVVGAIVLMLQIVVFIIDIGLKIVLGIMNWFSDLLIKYADAPWKIIITLVVMALQFIVNTIIGFLTMAWNFWNFIFTSIQTIVGTVLFVIGFIIASALAWIITQFGLLATRVITKVLELKIGAVEKIKALIAWLQENVPLIKKEIEDRFTEAKDKAIALAKDIYDGISGKIGEILTYLTDPATLQGFIDAGSKFVQGIIDGIANMAGALATAIGNMVSGMFTTAATEGEQHSPSRRAAREIGKPFMQGISMGISQAMGGLRSSVIGAMNTMVMPPASAAQIGASSVSNTSTKNVTYAPTYNTSAPPPQYDMAILEVWAR